MKIITGHTETGVQHLSFTSANGNSFSLQQTSSAQLCKGLWLSMDSKINIEGGVTYVSQVDGKRPHMNKSEAKELANMLNKWADSGELFEEEIMPEKDAEISIKEFFDRSIKCIIFIGKFQFSKSVPVLTTRTSYLLKNNPGINGVESEEIKNSLIIWSMGLSQWSDANSNMRVEIFPVHAGFVCNFHIDQKMCTDDKITTIVEKTQHMRNAYIWGMESICRELGMKD